jgi:phospholipid/cholesterol/gamma-HCH transport system ATP-binding protein
MASGTSGNGNGNGETLETEIGLVGLTKTFGSQTVWEDITCDIPKAKITVMLGPSGTGKSVLLKHIMGLLKPDRGEIWIDGKNIPSLPERELYKIRRKFGVLFQDGALFGSMNVYDNTAFPLREHTKKGEKEIRDIVTEKLTMVGLVGAEKKLPGEISGGMKKRAGLARALVLDPEIVMFDEPDSGLDPVRTAFLSELIRDLNASLGMCSVVVTHDIATTRRVADYIGMLAQRKLVRFGTAKEMFESDIPVVRQFLAGDTEGPIGMAEEKDADILGEGKKQDAPEPVEAEAPPQADDVEAQSSKGMTADEVEEMERAAGAPEEPAEGEKVRALSSQGEGDSTKQGQGLPEGFSLGQMLGEGKEEQG